MADSQQTTQLTQAVDAVAALVDGPDDPIGTSGATYWASERRPGDVVVKVGQSRYPMPPQDKGWHVPPAVREYAVAILWRVLRSQTAPHLTKIRAVEALVKLDTHTLATERQDDWREVQSARSSRSNVRVLAELARKAE